MGTDVELEGGECPHGLGQPDWCQLCNGKAERQRRREAAEKAARKKPPAWLIARFKEQAAIEFARQNPPSSLIQGCKGGDVRVYRYHGLLFENDEDRMPRRLPR